MRRVTPSAIRFAKAAPELAEFLFPRAGKARLHITPNLGANVVATVGILPIA